MDRFQRLENATQATYIRLQAASRMGKIAPEYGYLLVDNYTRAANIELAERLLEFPRELRDMVYTHLWTKEPQKNTAGSWTRWYDPGNSIVKNTMRLLNKNPRCKGPPCTCMRSLPHFVNLNFVGAEVARETNGYLKEVLNRRDIWPDRFYVAACNIEAFVHEDILHIGIPMVEVIRDFDIDFDLGDQYENATGIYRDVNLRGRSDVKYLRKAADALRSIRFEKPSGSRLNKPRPFPPRITFGIYQRQMTFSELSTLFEIFGPVLFDFHNRGFRTKLVYNSPFRDMRFFLYEQAWKWTIPEWRKNLRDKNQPLQGARGVMSPFRATPSEEDIEAQVPTWELIMHHVYRVELGGVDETSGQRSIDS